MKRTGERRRATRETEIRVRVDLVIPGHEVVYEEHSEDVYATIDAVFDHVGRKLAEISKRKRHGADSHASLKDVAIASPDER